MRKIVFLTLMLLASSCFADLTVGGFYDPARQLAIAEANWFSVLSPKWKAYGFLEAYREPMQGYPSNSNVLFGKSWLMYEVSKDVSVGFEIEHGYNNAGMWTRSNPFQADKFIVIPKFGASWRVQ